MSSPADTNNKSKRSQSSSRLSPNVRNVLSLPPKWLAKYDDFVTKNASQVAQMESALRSLTYIIPGTHQASSRYITIFHLTLPPPFQADSATPNSQQKASTPAYNSSRSTTTSCSSAPAPPPPPPQSASPSTRATPASGPPSPPSTAASLSCCRSFSIQSCC